MATNENSTSETQDIEITAAMADTKPDITLSSGRVVTHTREARGNWLATMADGGPMSEAEWSDYCLRVQLASVDATDAAKRARHEASKAAFRARKGGV